MATTMEDRRYLWLIFSALLFLGLVSQQNHHYRYQQQKKRQQTTTLTSLPKYIQTEISIQKVESKSPLFSKLLGQDEKKSPLVTFSFPNVDDFIPNNPSLHLQFHLQSNNLTAKAKIVFGILMMRREYRHYLINILRDLIVMTDENEREDLLAVVFVTRECHDLVQKIVKDITEGFLYDGLIEVISVTPEGYPVVPEKPNFDHLTKGIGRKYNVDIAYLMAYARLRGEYFVQLEDDARVNQNMMVHSVMQTIDVVSRRNNQTTWFVIDFAKNLKFSGKLFKTDQLHYLIQELVMYTADKTYQWLLEDVMVARFCSQFIFWIKCGNSGDKNTIWAKNVPQLFEENDMALFTFQKILNATSAEKLIANTTDMEANVPMGANPIFKKVNSTINEFKNHTFERLLKGLDYFWGKSPAKDSSLTILFKSPLRISNYYFLSGHSEAKDDIFRDTVVEIQPAAINEFILDPNITFTEDSYTEIGDFDKNGTATGNVPKRFLPIVGIRVRVIEDSKQWVLLREVKLEQTLPEEP